jgi:hypothetical protein
MISAPVATLDTVNFRLRLCDWESAKSAISEAADAKAGDRADAYHEQESAHTAVVAHKQLREAQLSALASHAV